MRGHIGKTTRGKDLRLGRGTTVGKSKKEKKMVKGTNL